MSEEKKVTDDFGHIGPQWEAISMEAELKVSRSIEKLCELLTTKNRLDLLARVATYILFSPGGKITGKEDSQKSEVNLEYLCSLATALPDSSANSPPSADDVQNAIDLLATIRLYSTVFYSALRKPPTQETDHLAELATSFRIQKLNVRGDGYWHHLKKTWHDILEPHAEAFRKSAGFSFSDYFCLGERLERLIEDRVNLESGSKVFPYIDVFGPWLDELKNGDALSDECQQFLQENHDQIEALRPSFDEFGSPDSFLVDANSIEESHILTHHSCGFGDNREFLGRSDRFRFWPLNDTLTDKKPFIQHQGRYYAFNFSKIGRNAYDFAMHVLREKNPRFWEDDFCPARDAYLEEETARLFRKLFPQSTILETVFYPLKAGGQAEADIVVILDDVLLVVECKAGSITPAAKRGGPMRVATDVEKTVAKGLSQAERLVTELTERGEMIIEGKNSKKVILKAMDFEWVFRINVTLDLINTVSSSIWSLSDIGLLNSTERCWSVSLNDLRVIVDILDKPAVFLHYLIRRCDTDLIRQVEAADELDYMMYYIVQGLFFRGKNAPKENEHVQIGTYTDDLDQYYRRLQGLQDRGSKPRIALGPHTERFLELLRKWQPKNWISASLQFMEFDRPCREDLLGRIHSHFKKIRGGRSRFGISVIGCSETKTAIALVCALNPEASKDIVRARCIKRCKDYGLRSMVVIVVGMPVSAVKPIVLCITPDDSATDQANRLLAMLRFDVTERHSSKGRPGIFDGIREERDDGH